MLAVTKPSKTPDRERVTAEIEASTLKFVKMQRAAITSLFFEFDAMFFLIKATLLYPLEHSHHHASIACLLSRVILYFDDAFVTLEQRTMKNKERNLPKFSIRCINYIEDSIRSKEGLHVAFKTLAYAVLVFYLWLGWKVLPIGDHWSLDVQSGGLTTARQPLTQYFVNFEGFSECNIHALDLYIPPPKHQKGKYSRNFFCKTRRTLLQAMSTGGRIGFDAPYLPRGCHYRWFTTPEICFILDRFDGLVFIGDSSLKSIFSGLNILWSQNLATGTLNVQATDKNLIGECRCNNQFVKQNCLDLHATSREQIQIGDHSHVRSDTPHAFIEVTSPKTSPQAAEKLKKLVPPAPRSRFKSIPIIYSVSPSSFTSEDAQSLMLEILKLADVSKRKTPMLWVGPTAAGHVEVKGRKGNQEIWHFDRRLAEVADDNDIEVLGMWNMTVQSSSWDGLRFGEKVAVTQAMMVLNWLSQLESS